MPSIHCQVVTPTGRLFKGEAAQVKAPGWDGGFGLKPRHAPYLVALKAGPLVLEDGSGGELLRLEVESGYLLIAKEQCTLLVEKVAEAPEA